MNLALESPVTVQQPVKTAQSGPDSAARAFTAAEIAEALGMTSRGARKALRAVPPTCQAIVRGRKATADAWAIADWPEPLRIRGQNMAARLRHRSILELFELPISPFRMPIPWDQVPHVHRDRAEKLRLCLASLMPLRGSMPAAELQDRGILEYDRVFGYQISAKRWRQLFDQVLERDGGQELWQRLDLYIDARAFSQEAPKREIVRDLALHRPLDEVVSNLANRRNPDRDDVAWLKDSAFNHYELLIEGKTEPERRAILRSLIHYLFTAVPALSRNEASLRRWFQINYQAWVDGGKVRTAIEDKRPLKSGKFGKRLCKDCRLLVIGGAVDLDGDLAQAWGRLHLTNKLCAHCAERWPFDPQHKDYVPVSVREDVAPEIKSALALRRGPKYARRTGPKVRRDWSRVPPCDVFSADDVTWNHPFWYLDENGQIRICRGECLLLTDERTGYIIHHLLIAGILDGKRTSYTGWNIRQLFLAGHDRFGLPHWGFSLENGIWRSRLVAGEPRSKWIECRWSDAEAGLREEGLDLDLHYHLPGQPWTKPIEGVIGMVQQRMGCEPFYVGRNERLDKREKTAEQIKRVRSGIDPAKVGMRSMEEFRDVLDKIISEYNATVQNGEMLRDACGRYMSPQEAIWEGICGMPGNKARPLKKLSAHSRALLATHKRLCYVNDDGLTVKVNNTPWPYWGEALAPYKHQHIWAYLNFDEPEVLVCSDEARENYFTLTAKVLPARGASKQQMETMSRERGAFMRGARVLHSQLPHPYLSTVTNENDADARTSEFSRVVDEATAAHESQAGLEDKLMRRLVRNCRVLGRQAPARVRGDLEAYVSAQEEEIKLLGLRDEVDHA